MGISELLTKENIYKALAVLGVAVFVFEMFAFGLVGRNRSNVGNQNATPVVEGAVDVNATVLDYQPYIITNLRNEAIAENLKALPDVDEVLLSPSGQGYIIGLRSADNLTGVYSYLRTLNVSGTANAVLSLQPFINISSANGTQLVPGGEISARIEPLFQVDDNITIRVFLHAENGQITQYGSVAVLPRQEMLLRNGTIFAVAGMKTTIYVPWEARAEVGAQLDSLKDKYGNASVSYDERDYIVANSTFSSGNTPDYVKLIAGDTVYVPANFTDRGKVENDFRRPTFPDSVLTINGNASEVASEFGNFSRNVSYKYNVRLEQGGQPLFAALETPDVHAENETLLLKISAYAIKDNIVSVISVQEAQ